MPETINGKTEAEIRADERQKCIETLREQGPDCYLAAEFLINP